jgi:hypothetical protein
MERKRVLRTAIAVNLNMTAVRRTRFQGKIALSVTRAGFSDSLSCA